MQDIEATKIKRREKFVHMKTNWRGVFPAATTQFHKDQTLDLEGLAHHRGSLLGAEPGLPQPPQRLFESRLYERL